MSLVRVLKVLVVDDMAVSRELIIQALTDAGIVHIREAADGREALRMMRENPDHLVICDYNMPNMTGIGLLQSLRQNPKTCNVGFILVTGKATAKILEAGKKLRMNNYLLKPFEPSALIQKVGEVFGPLSEAG